MAEPPTGTVTLLFTDIEGSTRLLEQLGDRYAEALATHRALLRAAFAAWHGYEVDTQGDAFFVAFARASEAVSAAIDGQRALLRHDWPHGAMLRVRIGVHTGEPLLAGEGYVGLDVHRAARICAAAHGGQVLLSRTTADLIAHDPPQDLTLLDLGEHRLKDIVSVERIFQTVTLDLPVRFPPIASLEALPNDLPVPVLPGEPAPESQSEAQRLVAATSIDLPDLIRILRLRLQPRAGSVPRLRTLEFSSARLSIDAANAMLFEFPTLQAGFSALYRAPVYRMLLCLGLSREPRFDPRLLNELDRLRARHAIDRIIVWSTVEVDAAMRQLLKGKAIDLVNTHVDAGSALFGRPLPEYVPFPSRPLEYSLLVNYVAADLVKRLRKLFHLALSEVAAPILDRHYARRHAGTRAFFDYETARIQRLTQEMKDVGRNAVAVEIGCGTGRHSFLLARGFAQVYAYDMAPRMIEIARQAQLERGDTRISFAVNDFEYEELADEDRFYGHCDLIIATAGMGSFVEDTVHMLRRFHDWLRPDGRIFLSFFNEDSLAARLAPAERDAALATRLDPANESLSVELPGGICFDIFCKPFDETTSGEINKLFDIDELTSYPTLQALLPNALLQDEFARQLFGEIDALVADPAVCGRAPLLKRPHGHYVLVSAHKRESSYEGYATVLRLLASQPSIEYEVIEHGPVLSLEDVRRELGDAVPLSSLVKTLIFKLPRSHRFIAVALPGDRQIDRDATARRFGLARSQVKFASEKEVAALGFPLGGIAPFGFPEGAPVRRLVDVALRDGESGWLYLGMGDNRRTLRLRRTDFVRLVGADEWTEL